MITCTVFRAELLRFGVGASLFSLLLVFLSER